jgi:hypothetical protein
MDSGRDIMGPEESFQEWFMRQMWIKCGRISRKAQGLEISFGDLMDMPVDAIEFNLSLKEAKRELA